MLTGVDGNELVDSSLKSSAQTESETQPQYFDMDHVFWVKLSDFMDLVPHIPHLHGLDIKFIRMNIGQEFVGSGFGFQPNGYFGGSPAEDGFLNGYGFSRPSAYV